MVRTEKVVLLLALSGLVVCSRAAMAQSSFQRGDSNADGLVNISDASHLLSFLFLGGGAPPCLDAADANDDGVIDVSDGPFSLGYLFLGGSPPPPPFASCGIDPSADRLGCASFPPCPQEPTFPHPDPDPCAELGAPCESAVIGPYTLVSTPDGDGVFTLATHQAGEVFHLRWVPLVEGGKELFFSRPEWETAVPLALPGNVPALRSANFLAAVGLILNGPGPAAGAGGGAEDEFPGNHAGCDPHGWMKWADCTSCGGCCDTHDACIDANCNGRNDSGDVRVCAGRRYELIKCRLTAITPVEWLECGSLPHCSDECLFCHRQVIECFEDCANPFVGGPGPSECCARDDCGKPQQCISNGGIVETNPDRCLIPEAEGWGDPHLITFDRLAYDFQAVGEFILARSTVDDLELQARTTPWRGSRHVAVMTAVAMNVAGDRVGVYLERTPALVINGVPTMLDAAPITLPGGGRVELAGRTFTMTWPDASRARVTLKGSYLNVKIGIAPRRRRAVEGLLGQSDGNRANDLTGRDGVVLVGRPTLEALYRVYGESWRLELSESLFDYAEGETPETFADRSFPDGLASAQSLTAAARSVAEAACAQAGVTDPYLLEMCILDVGFTGESEFAENLGEIAPPQEEIETPICAAPAVTWTDWTSGNNRAAAGNLGPIAVTLTGVIANLQVQGGNNYWARNPATYTYPGLVESPPGTSDIVVYTGGAAAGVQTLSFSVPVVDPVMAIFSLGRPGVPTRYEFDTPFEILTVGPGWFGNGTLERQGDNVLVGAEGYGLIRFRGLVSTITWTLPVAENWHGMQVGVVNCR